MERIRVVHIINSFEFGGAEAMLVNLLLRCDRTRYEPHVVSLIDDLSVAQPIIDAEIPLAVMHIRPTRPDPRYILRLARHLRRLQPDVVQTWMDHSNLIGLIAAKLSTRAPVVWGIHHSEHVAGVAKWSTQLTVNICGLLSSFTSRIICCSQHSRTKYIARDFAPERITVIPNGFDTERFAPDPQARQEIRRELGIDDSTPLIGLAARFDPCKDHKTFVQAAAILSRRRPDAHFLLCGTGVDLSNHALMTQIRQAGLTQRCHLLGPRRDVPRIHAAVDIATSSSISEAFPLVVGEAMSCGVPCVVTDVGDSALMVGSTGLVVPPRQPAALAAAWDRVLAMTPQQRQAMGAAARQRVQRLYDLDVITRRYHDVYDALVMPQPAVKRAKPAPEAMPAAVAAQIVSSAA